MGNINGSNRLRITAKLGKTALISASCFRHLSGAGADKVIGEIGNGLDKLCSIKLLD